MSFNEKFDTLLDILESGKKLPFSNMVMVNSDVAQKIAIELKETFPEEFRSAQRLLNEKDSFIETARKEALSIKEDALKEREQLVGKESIVKEAEEKIIQMKENAKKESVEILKNMSSTMIEIANQFRENLVTVDRKMSETYKSISENIQKIKLDYIEKV